MSTLSIKQNAEWQAEPCARAALQYAQQAEAQLLNTGKGTSGSSLLLALFTSLAAALTANKQYEEAVQTYEMLLRMQPQVSHNSLQLS